MNKRINTKEFCKNNKNKSLVGEDIAISELKKYNNIKGVTKTQKDKQYYDLTFKIKKTTYYVSVKTDIYGDGDYPQIDDDNKEEFKKLCKKKNIIPLECQVNYKSNKIHQIKNLNTNSKFTIK